MFVRRMLALACALAAAATTALTAPPAGASHAGYAVAQVRLPDGRLDVLRWNGCQDITYKVNLAALPASQHGQARWEIRVALGELAERTGLRFTDRGTTSEVPQIGSGPRQSAELVIAYTTPYQTNHDLGGSGLGKGGYQYNTWWQRQSDGSVRWHSAITRGFVVLDTYDALTRLRPGFGYGMTRGNLLLHELGHVVGLDHVDDSSQLMATTLSPYTPANYGSGDTAGLRRVGTSYGCIELPNWIPDLD